jgi:hypothetical protein
MSTLKGLRQQREAALKARYLDIPVAGLDGIVARFRPVTVAVLQRERARMEKAKDQQAANKHLNAALLGDAFQALLDGEGETIADGITPEFIEEFCPDFSDPGLVTQADAMIGLFTDDFPLFKAGGQLVQWSQAVEGEVDGDPEA